MDIFLWRHRHVSPPSGAYEPGTREATIHSLSMSENTYLYVRMKVPELRSIPTTAVCGESAILCLSCRMYVMNSSVASRTVPAAAATTTVVVVVCGSGFCLCVKSPVSRVTVAIIMELGGQRCARRGACVRLLGAIRHDADTTTSATDTTPPPPPPPPRTLPERAHGSLRAESETYYDARDDDTMRQSASPALSFVRELY